VLKYGGENCVNRLKIQSVKRERRNTRIYSTRKRYALCPTADSQLRLQLDLFRQQAERDSY
jgi:hypothetical protein